MVRHGLQSVNWDHFLNCVIALVFGIALGCFIMAIDEGHWNDRPYDIVLPGSAEGP